MGVLYFNTAGRPHSLSTLKTFSAAASAYFLGNGTGEANISLRDISIQGFMPSVTTNVGMESTFARGTTTVPGAGYRHLLVDASNCQVNIAYPSNMYSTLYNSSTDTALSYSRTYITTSETTNGYALYCRAVSYTDYQYIQISANNFNYGYSTGTWVWYNSSGNFVTTAGFGSTLTLYVNSYTGTEYYRLRHVAS